MKMLVIKIIENCVQESWNIYFRILGTILILLVENFVYFVSLLENEGRSEGETRRRTEIYQSTMIKSDNIRKDKAIELIQMLVLVITLFAAETPGYQRKQTEKESIISKCGIGGDFWNSADSKMHEWIDHKTNRRHTETIEDWRWWNFSGI